MFVPEKPFQASVMKHTHLLDPFVERKFVNTVPGVIFTNFIFLTTSKLEFLSLFGPLISYEENKVLLKQPQGRIHNI